MKPRVLLLHNFLTPYRVPLFTELARRFDFEVWILGDIRRLREWSGDAPEAAFRYQRLPHVSLPVGTPLGRRYNTLLINHTLPRLLARHGPDVLIACGWDAPAMFYASAWARWSNTPFILWSGSTSAEHSLLRALTRPAVKAMARSARAWIAYGTQAKEYLATLGADPARTYCAFNTVETDVFAAQSRLGPEERDAFKRRLGISARNVVLYCGNLLDLKGVGDLLQAFAKFVRHTASAERRHDIALLLVGSGTEEAKYRAMGDALGLGSRVLFTGYVPREELPAYYAVADLLVLPSHTEVWGLVINEALACGVPVMATDVCGAAADLIQDNVNGYVIPPHSPAALCAVLERHFSRTEEERTAMSDAARRSIAPFTIARAADAFEEAVTCALRGV